MKKNKTTNISKTNYKSKINIDRFKTVLIIFLIFIIIAMFVGWILDHNKSSNKLTSEQKVLLDAVEPLASEFASNYTYIEGDYSSELKEYGVTDDGNFFIKMDYCKLVNEECAEAGVATALFQKDVKSSEYSINFSYE